MTYGERHRYCIDAIQALAANSVDHVLLILNGAADTSAREIARALEASFSDRHSVHQFEQNMGSAPAFAAGIRIARSLAPQWTILLDDDNMLADGALDRAITELSSKQGASHAIGSCARVSLGRTDVMTPRRTAPPRGSFQSADIFSWLEQRLRFSRASSGLATVQDVTLHQAPYGGLLLPEAALSVEGPREHLVLYSDDLEYTRRLVSSGFTIYWCEGSRIYDLEARGFAAHVRRADAPEVGGVITRSKRSREESPTRAYFHYRNSASIDLARCRSRADRMRLMANIMVYSVRRFAIWRRGDWSLSRVYCRAILDGLQDNLSRPPKWVSLERI